MLKPIHDRITTPPAVTLISGGETSPRSTKPPRIKKCWWERRSIKNCDPCTGGELEVICERFEISQAKTAQSRTEKS
jgi:hypothetical protein